MESKKYPYTATQWHPEKNAFEWGDKLHIPHSKEAIDVTYAGVPTASLHSLSFRMYGYKPRQSVKYRHHCVVEMELASKHTQMGAAIHLSLSMLGPIFKGVVLSRDAHFGANL